MYENLIPSMKSSLQPMIDVAKLPQSQQRLTGLTKEELRISARMADLKGEAEMLLDMLNERKELHKRLLYIEKTLKSANIEDEALYQSISSQRPEIAEYRCRYEFLQEDWS